MKICQRCGREYWPRIASKYCPSCAVEARSEWRAKWLSAHPGYNKQWRLEHRELDKAHKRKLQAKRRALGFVPINEPFEGADAHHMDKVKVAYIPRKLHQSIPHNVWSGWNMDKINAAVHAYLGET